MDEVKKTKWVPKIASGVRSVFFHEPVTFSKKPSVNLKGILYMTCCFTGLFCVAVLMVPTTPEQARTFSERKEQAATGEGAGQTPAPTLNPLSASSIQTAISTRTSSGSGGGATSNRNTPMVIERDNDISTTLPAGTKFWVTLYQNATITNRPIPVIGEVSTSVISSNSVAITEGAKIYGEAVLDSESERAGITWKSIQFPDGRSKNLTALALGNDNQLGVEGAYHSDALKNTAGQMITRFVGGFATGAISQGPLGASQGGVQNGIYQGFADTAKDRADAWGEDLKKPKAWIELSAGIKFQTILSQPFTFRDPGGTN